MFTKFLAMKKVRKALLDYDMIFELLLREVTDRLIPDMNDSNLSIYIKTIAQLQHAGKIKVSNNFWLMANNRFTELENEMSLRNLSFIIYGLNLIKALDTKAFLMCVVRALLRNQTITMLDLSMILNVAQEMTFTDEDCQS